MGNKLFYSQKKLCLDCKEVDNPAFRYVESPVGEKIIFKNNSTYTVVFILSGEALISCNEFVNVPIRAGQLTIFPILSSCVWETVTAATGIVLETKRSLSPCDREQVKHYADKYPKAEPVFGGIPIKPRLSEFLNSMKNYIKDGIKCPYMHNAKEEELASIFRAYYSSEELEMFYLPTVMDTQEFKYFIMQNYLKMKGVAEFVDLSGLTTSTFNRKFKSHFGTTPYQWMMKQKSKHILHELTTGNKKISEIMREFQFQNASHFNYYCRTVLGATPTELRAQKKNK